MLAEALGYYGNGGNGDNSKIKLKIKALKLKFHRILKVGEIINTNKINEI